MNYEVVKECAALAEQEKIAFPEVVARLDKAEIDFYYTDLLIPNKTFYANNEAFVVPCSFNSKKKVSNVFKADKVVQAIRLCQSMQIKYQEFIKLVKEAGVISYFVFIKGRKMVYFGKRGEQLIENFP